MQEKANPADNANAYLRGLTNYCAKRCCFEAKLPYEHSAFATGVMLYIGYKNINVSIKNDKIKESEHKVYELSWCRWPGSNRHGIATTGF